ncbi:MAG: hypothetical protein OXF43_06845 [Gammaproteobacteria bacterium]|nr:hypothetical protein [Gammaproteobacteria bacterium]
MAQVAASSRVGILDTSWLLELYRVPGHFDDSRAQQIYSKTDELITRNCELLVTVPVLFEVSQHITHVKSGHRRRTLSKKFRDNIASSVAEDTPWTIPTIDKGTLLRAEDIIKLADRFVASYGQNYSFADISIIDLTEQFRQKDRVVTILTFDKQLLAYSEDATR